MWNGCVKWASASSAPTSIIDRIPDPLDLCRDAHKYCFRFLVLEENGPRETFDDEDVVNVSCGPPESSLEISSFAGSG